VYLHLPEISEVNGLEACPDCPDGEGQA